MRHISWLAYVCSCVYILNIARKKIDFPSPRLKQLLSFVLYLLLKAIWNSTVVQWNILFQVFTSFLPPSKRVHSFNIANLFYFHSVTSVSYFYNQTFDSETRFKRLRSHVILTCFMFLNASCCSQRIIYICIVWMWSNYQSHLVVVGTKVLCCTHYSVPTYFRYL